MVKLHFINEFLNEKARKQFNNDEFLKIVRDYQRMMIYFEGSCEDVSYYIDFFDEWFHICKIYVDDYGTL